MDNAKAAIFFGLVFRVCKCRLVKSYAFKIRGKAKNHEIYTQVFGNKRYGFFTA